MLQAVQGKEGSGVRIDYSGTEVVAVWRYIPLLNWELVAKIDTDEAFATIYMARNYVFSIGVLIMLVSLLAAYIMSRKISNPIRTLQRSMERVGMGNVEIHAYPIFQR